jgi:hypothetical protein
MQRHWRIVVAMITAMSPVGAMRVNLAGAQSEKSRGAVLRQRLLKGLKEKRSSLWRRMRLSSSRS